MRESSSALEIAFTLNREAQKPMRHHIAENLRGAIRDGRLAAGAKLPSTRALAVELGVSRGVITAAYAQLVSEGYLEGRVGAVPRVRALPLIVPPRARRTPQRRPPLHDLVGTMPDLSLFPRRQWLAAIQHVLRVLPDAALGYDNDPRGAEALRKPLAEYLARVRGLTASSEEILITQGYTQGLALTCRVLAREGARRIAVEDPSDDDQWETLRRSGLEILPVPVDESGIDVEEIERADPDVVLITGAHQFPTGVVLASSRRAQLASWLHRHDRLLIEDDYDSAYRYDRDPVGTLQALAPSNVVQIGSVSKLLAPGLRLGWAVAPPSLLRAIAAERWAQDSGHQAIDQHAFGHFLSSGELDRHLRRTRPIYRSRRDKLIETLLQQIPDARVEGVAAGLHLVVRLPDDVTEVDIVRGLAKHRIRVRGIDEYRLDRSREGLSGPALVLGFGRLPEPSVEAVVRALQMTLTDARVTNARRTSRLPHSKLDPTAGT